MLLSITSKIIRDARLSKNLTQQKLAEKLHVTTQAVSNWERGENFPDESLRDNLEKILGVELRNEQKMKNQITHFGRRIPDLKPLGDINNIDDVMSSVETIIEAVTIQEHEHVVKKMLNLALIEILGSEIYYYGYCHHFYTDYPLDWASTADDLGVLIDDEAEWIDGDTTFPFQANSQLIKKVHFIAFLIGGELFEDFDDEGYRSGFVQQIGKLGEKSGYSLMSLLPETNTDILVTFKVAIMDIIDILSVICPNDWEE